MNYVGKILSNFKEFYKEINSATLTGAIDVIVVEQEDGSFVSSPFHVRFGKMGVIRAREKVVDIEVNKRPVVDVHMKLGEAGEAFFVQEIEKEEEKDEIPAYLATSPLPSSINLMEQGIEELHQQVAAVEAASSTTITEMTDMATEPTFVINDVDDDVTPTIEDNRFTTITRKDSDQSVYMSTHNTLDNFPQTEEDFASIDLKKATEIKICLGDPNTVKIKQDVAVQTEVLGDEVTRRAKSPLPWHQEVGKEVSHSHSANGVTAKETSSMSDLVRNDSRVSLDSEVSSADLRPMRKRRRKRVNRKKEILAAKDESGSSIEDVPEDALFPLEMSEEDEEIVNIGRTVSLPQIHSDKQQATENWANHQFASSCHPFSDGDITPIVSPVGSRPPSPKSDTELEYQKYDAGAQTMLTGDDFEIADIVNWRWGEIPQTPATTPDAMPSLKEEEKPSGGLFQFMRKTKNLRHRPEQEGIYLDDLNMDDMDPEVAALYLYQKNPPQPSKDDDAESGRGASLPQSPVSVERDHHDVVRPQPVHPDMLPEIAMSMCGGLRQPEMVVSQEKFLQYMVNYNQLCQDPNMLTNPNLVIKIENKYYNWQIAGPMVMSALAYQRPLSEDAITSLIKEHMPKKEAKRRGWIWWRTVEEEKKDGVNTINTNPQPSSLPSSPQKIADRRRHLTNDMYSTDESDIEKDHKSPHNKSLDSIASQDSAIVTMTTSKTVSVKTQSTATCTNDNAFKKTLKLTSDQLKKLNLEPGRNSITFSVTTQYQGTSSCEANIFLWKWTDKIIVSDIDGTITKSDVLGQILPVIGKDWSQAGIAHLYNMISNNGYKFIYLSARAIGQARITRDYLRWIRQGELGLPGGPLLLSPSSLISAFHREVIERKPEEFKISCLRDITALFPADCNPLCAGFGNKINDVWAYRAVGIPISRIFTVNHKGELRMEVHQTFTSSYRKLGDIVDHFFPPLQVPAISFHAPSDFSSFTYWREPFIDIKNELESLKAAGKS